MNTLLQDFREFVENDKTYKKDTDLTMEASYDVQYPTGFMDLDYHLGQRVNIYDNNGNIVDGYDSVGIVDGSINFIVGRTGCGKSTFAKQVAGNIIKPFPTACIFEDNNEGGITGRRNEILLGMSPEETHNRLRMRNSGISAESFFKTIKFLRDFKLERKDSLMYDTGKRDSMGNPIKKFIPDVYILDSLAVLAPEKMTEQDEVSGQMSQTASAKTLAQIFRRIPDYCKQVNIILFVINHITDDVSINPMQKKKAQMIYLDQGETMPGGKTPPYMATTIFRLEDSRKTKEMEALDVTGVFVDVCIIKSRTSIARRDPACTLIFEQDKGFNAILSLLTSFKSYNMIGGAGAYLYLDGRDDIKFSQKKFQELLSTNPDFYNAFIDTCAKIFGNMLTEKPSFSPIDPLAMNADIMKKIGTAASSVETEDSSNDI